MTSALHTIASLVIAVGNKQLARGRGIQICVMEFSAMGLKQCADTHVSIRLARVMSIAEAEALS